jgi:hypothetical protein
LFRRSKIIIHTVLLQSSLLYYTIIIKKSLKGGSRISGEVFKILFKGNGSNLYSPWVIARQQLVFIVVFLFGGLGGWYTTIGQKIRRIVSSFKFKRR